MIFRHLTNLVLKSLKNMPAVFINGPRQAGKSTLAKEIADNHIGADYITFDDISMISAAQSDPMAFLDNFNKPVVLDEIQMAPKLFSALKQKIDFSRLNKKKINGQFLLTGSANIMTLPQLSHALVGRMDVMTLYQLSTKEINDDKTNVIDVLFDKDFSKINSLSKMSVEKSVMKATFPQIAVHPSIDTSRWFESYISTIISRDLKNISEITKITSLVQMIKILASRAGCLLNNSSLARDTGLNNMTFLRYKTLLEGLFLINTIEPWYKNIGKRLVKSPKIYFTDTFLLCHLLGVDLKNVKKQNANLFGKIVENFVASELTKQISQKTDVHLYHFRTSDNKEVDFIIEKNNGDLIGMEVKSSLNVTAGDFSGLKTLQSLTKKKFKKGIILYQGQKIIPFAPNLFAVPISIL